METVKQIEYNGTLYDIQDAEAQKNLVYSQEETDTGKIWIDGKKIYRKVVDCGGLLNSVLKKVPHNLQNLKSIVNMSAITIDIANNKFIPLSYANISPYQISIAINGDNIELGTSTDRTNFTQTFVILEYTKTTN